MSTSQQVNETKRRVFNQRYAVDHQLGKGRFGVVFLIEDLNESTRQQQVGGGGGERFKVAKRVSLDSVSDEDLPAIKAEAQLLAKLDHPNIVMYFDSFIDATDNSFIIVTEYCDGGDLRSQIKLRKEAGEVFDERTIIDWFIQLMRAVEHLHEKDILHRDISTGNIFLKMNRIKLGDFGCSRILKSAVDVAVSFVGTPLYMSPEMLNLEDYDSKADIWSCGCVLYELCLLETLFTVKGVISLSIEIQNKQMPQLPARYSQDLSRLFLGMVRKDPKLRPSAAEILRDPFLLTNGSTFRRRRRRRRHVNAGSLASSGNSSSFTPPQSFWPSNSNIEIDVETREWFANLDLDQNGYINSSELQLALFSNGSHHFDQKAIQVLFDLFDINKDDIFDLNEFAEIIGFIRQRRRDFDRISQNREKVDLARFSDAILANPGYKLSLETFKLALRKFGDGDFISFDGYLLAYAFFKLCDEQCSGTNHSSEQFDQFVQHSMES